MKTWLVVNSDTRLVTSVVTLFGEPKPVDGSELYEKPADLNIDLYSYNYSVDTNGSIKEHLKG
jgi:hypothetical protein